MSLPYVRDRHGSTMGVAYLGPPASFSHQAAIVVFDDQPDSDSKSQQQPQQQQNGPASILDNKTTSSSTVAKLASCPSFTSVFTALQGDNLSTGSGSGYDFAILPIENSTNGSVVSVLDLLAQCSTNYPDLEVCGEHYLSVHHYLFGDHDRSRSISNINGQVTSLDDYAAIKTLYTHPQVWTQCSTFLSKHLSHAERIDVSSTSAAAALVAKSGTNDAAGSAAICSSLAGQLHGLHCLAERIEDEPGANTTRFFVLRNQNRRQDLPGTILPTSASIPTATSTDAYVNVKSLILFTISHHTPGSLSQALNVFAKHGLNLTRIDTRPNRHSDAESQSQDNGGGKGGNGNGNGSWRYVFFVECEEHLPATALSSGEESRDQGKLGKAMKELGSVTESVRCLGRWVDMLQFEERKERSGVI